MGLSGSLKGQPPGGGQSSQKTQCMAWVIALVWLSVAHPSLRALQIFWQRFGFLVLSMTRSLGIGLQGNIKLSTPQYGYGLSEL